MFANPPLGRQANLPIFSSSRMIRMRHNATEHSLGHPMRGAAAEVTQTPRLETGVRLLSHLVTQLAGAHISGSTSRVVYHKDRGEKEG